MKTIKNILRGLGIVVAMSIALSSVAVAATTTVIKLPKETESDDEDDYVTYLLKYHNVTLQEIKDIWVAYVFDGSVESFEEFGYTDGELASEFDNLTFSWEENLLSDGWESFADWTTEEGLEEMRATLTNPDDPNTVLTEKQVNALSDYDLAAVYSLWYRHELYDVLGY